MTLRSGNKYTRVTEQALLCSACGEVPTTSPCSIQCDNCKKIYHPACLGNEAPADNEPWSCKLCADPIVSKVSELTVSQVIKTARTLSDQIPPDQVNTRTSNVEDDTCSICHNNVGDDDLGLQCDNCDNWKHSTCLGLSDEEYDNLFTTEDVWECSDCAIPTVLPTFNEDDEDLAKVKWNSVSGIELFETVNNIYGQSTSWRRNLFKVPTGKAGQEFVEEVTKCLKHFNVGSPLEPVALKMVMIIFPLLLQKPSAKSKTKQHSEFLARRLDSWKQGSYQFLCMK